MKNRYRSKSDYFRGEYENDPVGLLAAEIIIHAITDWRELVNRKAWLDKFPHLVNFDELRAFFRGEWCAFLMLNWDIEPAAILAQLEAELQQAMEKAKGSGENGL